MYYVRFPLSLRNVEDILHMRGIDICHETVRYWWNKLGPTVAKELKKKRTHAPSKWRWHLDEVFVKINGKIHYLWRAIDHEGTVIDCFVSKRRNKRAALKFLKKAVKFHTPPKGPVRLKPCFECFLKIMVERSLFDLFLTHKQKTKIYVFLQGNNRQSSFYFRQYDILKL